jgi:hypothetical protein
MFLIQFVSCIKADAILCLTDRLWISKEIDKDKMKVHGKHDDKRSDSKNKRVRIFFQLPLWMHIILIVWCKAYDKYQEVYVIQYVQLSFLIPLFFCQFINHRKAIGVCFVIQWFGSLLIMLTWGIYTLVAEKDDWYPKISSTKGKDTSTPSKYHFAYIFEVYYFTYLIFFMIEIYAFNNVRYEK